MKISEKTITYQGTCHCGKISFQVIVKKHEAIECNCSICRKKGFIHLIVSQHNFTLLKGEENLKTYTFNTHIAQHKFCKTCGIHPFYIPRSHPNSIDVNVRCLDEDVIKKFLIKPFDGKNWEQNVNSIINNK